jgi:hypothetical protein
VAAPDLVAAVVAALEANATVTTAFQDTWNQSGQTGTAKFFTDVMDQVPIPGCVVTEPNEEYEFMTSTTSNPETTAGVVVLVTGIHAFDIFASARQLTRTLGFYVINALNDYPFSVTNVQLMYYRMRRSSFQLPAPDLGGPAVPIIFRRQFIADYQFTTLLSLGGN